MDLVDRTTGFRDLSLEYNETQGCYGPTLGCMIGCVKYWLLLRGCRATCLGHSADPNGMIRAAGKCKAEDKNERYHAGPERGPGHESDA